MLLYFSLILLPIFMSILVMKTSLKSLQFSMVVFSVVLAMISVEFFLNPVTVSFSLGSIFHAVLIVVDTVLILYFLKEGFKFSSVKVWGLAAVQLALFIYAEMSISGTGADFVIDELSCFMFTVINIVGSLIVVFAVWYIGKEDISEERRRLFLVYLTLFLAIMNLIVVANSLMIFFLLFELTTLASYLLIGFRQDELSQNNALRALWMNQIGGVFILSAVIYGSFHDVAPFFDAVMGSNPVVLFVVALLAMGALVKGAQMPFDSWLLGAMVAPTPVSAILHSATMVKIAPFIVLKLSPAIAGTLVANILIGFGACVFVVGALYGLSREKFKEVLGYSTISLLGLMIAMAAMVGNGDPTIVYILIFFHAISKALLFILAGILEKDHHVKEIWQMDGLLHRAPLCASMVMIGFATITLPPFGLFFGKLFSIEVAAANLSTSPAYFILLLSLAFGSALLTLLYFKVASLMFSKRADTELYVHEKPYSYSMVAPYAFTLTLCFSAALLIQSGISVSMNYVWLSLAMIFIVPIWVKISAFKGIDRVKEYHCGEKEQFAVAQWSYTISDSIKTKVAYLGLLAFALIAYGGIL